MADLLSPPRRNLLPTPPFADGVMGEPHALGEPRHAAMVIDQLLNGEFFHTAQCRILRQALSTLLVVKNDTRSIWSGHTPFVNKLKAIGRRVATLRRNMKMTQADVAAAVGVTRSLIGEIEGGTQPGGLDTMVAIADQFKVPFDWLICRDVPPGGPLVGKFVNDPEQLTWLAYWDGLLPDERGVARRLLGLPPLPSKAA